MSSFCPICVGYGEAHREFIGRSQKASLGYGEESLSCVHTTVTDVSDPMCWLPQELELSPFLPRSRCVAAFRGQLCGLPGTYLVPCSSPNCTALAPVPGSCHVVAGWLEGVAGQA